jgi:hypothetical protein
MSAEEIDGMRRHFRERHAYDRIDSRFQIFAT